MKRNIGIYFADVLHSYAVRSLIIILGPQETIYLSILQQPGKTLPKALLPIQAEQAAALEAGSIAEFMSRDDTCLTMGTVIEAISLKKPSFRLLPLSPNVRQGLFLRFWK